MFFCVLRKGWLSFKELYKQATPEQEVGYKYSCRIARDIRNQRACFLPHKSDESRSQPIKFTFWGLSVRRTKSYCTDMTVNRNVVSSLQIEVVGARLSIQCRVQSPGYFQFKFSTLLAQFTGDILNKLCPSLERLYSVLTTFLSKWEKSED